MPENINVEVLFFNGRAVGVTLPNFVEQKIIETDPGFRGDTATGTTKPARIATGATINVPLFINVGDIDQDRHAHGRVPRARRARLSRPADGRRLRAAPARGAGGARARSGAPCAPGSRRRASSRSRRRCGSARPGQEVHLDAIAGRRRPAA